MRSTWKRITWKPVRTSVIIAVQHSEATPIEWFICEVTPVNGHSFARFVAKHSNHKTHATNTICEYIKNNYLIIVLHAIVHSSVRHSFWIINLYSIPMNGRMNATFAVIIMRQRSIYASTSNRTVNASIHANIVLKNLKLLIHAAATRKPFTRQFERDFWHFELFFFFVKISIFLGIGGVGLCRNMFRRCFLDGEYMKYKEWMYEIHCEIIMRLRLFRWRIQVVSYNWKRTKGN